MTSPKTIYYTPPDACDVPFNGTVQFESGYSKYDLEYRLVDPNEQSRIERIRSKIIETKDAWGGEGSNAYDVALSIIDEVNRSDES